MEEAELFLSRLLEPVLSTSLPDSGPGSVFTGSVVIQQEVVVKRCLKSACQYFTFFYKFFSPFKDFSLSGILLDLFTFFRHVHCARA